MKRSTKISIFVAAVIAAFLAFGSHVTALPGCARAGDWIALAQAVLSLVPFFVLVLVFVPIHWITGRESNWLLFGDQGMCTPVSESFLMIPLIGWALYSLIPVGFMALMDYDRKNREKR